VFDVTFWREAGPALWFAKHAAFDRKRKGPVESPRRLNSLMTKALPSSSNFDSINGGCASRRSNWRIHSPDD